MYDTQELQVPNDKHLSDGYSEVLHDNYNATRSFEIQEIQMDGHFEWSDEVFPATISLNLVDII